MDVGGKEAAASGATRSADPIAWMVDSLKDYAIFTLDAAGRVTSWNTGAERIIGYPAAAILGQPAARLYTGEDVAGALPQRQLEQAAAADHIESEEWHVRQDGSRFWAHVTTTALRDSAGRLGGFGIAAHPDSPKQELRWSDWEAPIDGVEWINPDTSWRVHAATGWRSRSRCLCRAR